MKFDDIHNYYERLVVDRIEELGGDSTSHTPAHTSPTTAAPFRA